MTEQIPTAVASCSTTTTTTTITITTAHNLPTSTSNAAFPFAIGGRYLHAKTRHPLTVRYIGRLPGGNEQVWLGVEYDDDSCGKGHSGTYKGKQVFQTLQPGAGAFIKYVPGSTPLVCGTTLVAAVEERYGALSPEHQLQSAPSQQEAAAVVLGSSNAAIIVEAPGMADVRKRIGRLERLREIGFDDEWVGTLGGSEEERVMFKERLKGVRTLDLSKNLVASWDQVAEITEHLQGLTTLVLNHSRMAPITCLSDAQAERYRSAFNNVVELHLGDAGYTWAEAICIASHFPHLEVLYLNDNSPLTSLALAPGQDLASLHLKTLSLDGCPIDTWTAIASGLVPLPSLECVNLSGMPITTIPERTGPAFANLTRIALSDARVTAWRDIDNLADWTGGKLQNLRISCAVSHEEEEAIVEESPSRAIDPLHMSGEPRSDRPILVAKLGALTMLNSTTVTSAERWDAELYYIHYVDHLPATVPTSTWGRYDELVKLHGPAEKAKPAQTTLKSKLINVNVIPPSGQTFTLRVLPSAPVSMFQKKAARTMKVAEVTVCTARRHDAVMGLWEPVEEMEEGREVGYYVTEGDYVVAVV